METRQVGAGAMAFSKAQSQFVKCRIEPKSFNLQHVRAFIIRIGFWGIFY